MAETILSPGVLTRENDQSQITAGPVEAGAAIIGPAVKGPVNKPTLVTSFNQYNAIFGNTVESGSQTYSYMTSIAAYNYFTNGGNSLLVTRVASGSFTAAESTEIDEIDKDSLITTLDALSGSITQTPSLQGVISESFDLTSSVAAFDATGSTTLSYSNVEASSTSGTGVGATFNITLANTASLTSLVVVNGGQNYVNGNTITFTSQSLGATAPGGTDMVVTLAEHTDIQKIKSFTGITSTGDGNGSGATFSLTLATGSRITNITSTGGRNYDVGEIITIASSSIQADDDLEITLVADDLTDGNISPFVLETLGEGTIFNSTGSDNKGALSNGTADNVRWEITSANTSSGTFSLTIRRGNDTHRAKAVLETWNDLSLDPKSPRYIEEVIGNQTENLILEDNGDYYIQPQGEFKNNSRYVRVKTVNRPTPDYFDALGNAKSEFTGSIPAVGSGSFDGATGDLFGSTAANFYDDVAVGNIQGLAGSDYNTAIQLLGNRDEFVFNVISAPGLTSQNAATQISSIVNLAADRGDALAVVDLVNYQAAEGAVISQAAGFDNSYAATYWPWVQTIDSGTGRQVWVPAGVVIPGVYAFTDRSAASWFAPAGLTRGALGNVIRAERKLPAASRDRLYAANINPIATFPRTGVVVFGQKTLQKRATALDRVNVRRLLIALKSFISQVADNLVFEQNTVATRNVFLRRVNPYLESVVQRQGLYAFKVVMDDTNNTADVVDRNELVGQIFLQPTRTAEYIILDFNVLPTGATFPA